jgi:uncharacterized Zn finger protein (UPF0148 family)
MKEVYTCTCGGQKFTIADGIITCPNCGMEYILQFLDENFKPKFESAEDFNERIKKEA